ncbi:MAG TPA: CPBP family intramembrane glutamic endopeptidase [Candidatus Eisenbacteria bacterium]
MAWRISGLPRPRVHGVFQPVPFLGFMAALSVATVAAVAFLLRRFEGRSLAALGLPRDRSALAGLAAGSLVGFVPVALTVALGVAFGYGDVVRAGGNGVRLGSALAPFLLGTVLISAWEEFLWRGYVLQVLGEAVGRGAAAVATALLWSAGHLFNEGATPIGLVATAASGVVLAWVVFRTGSLWLAFGYHVAWNVSSIHLFGLTTSGVEQSPALFHTTLRGPSWLAGGAYGFEASLVTGLLDVATLSALLLLAARRPGYPDTPR